MFKDEQEKSIFQFGVIIIVAAGVFGAMITGAWLLVVIAFIFGAPIVYTAILVLRLFSDSSVSILYGSDKNKNHKAIIKGMYQQANGLKMSGQYLESEKIYRDIFEEYPDELKARFMVANLLYTEIDNPRKALKEFRQLKRIINQEKLPFRDKESVVDAIVQIEEELKDERNQQAD